MIIGVFCQVKTTVSSLQSRRVNDEGVSFFRIHGGIFNSKQQWEKTAAEDVLRNESLST